MITGYLYMGIDEKKIKEDLKKGVNITVGVDASSLLDYITILEINRGGDPLAVLLDIKRSLLIALERIKEVSQDAKAEDKSD